ncbi:hypothetical protein E4U42_003156 [Claviceps africana]|uniref:Lipid droplet-associated hydrolase n=1 Tax=Claviceps africana TaxID=83212 RepID=A0A8K0J7A9_9HYPO|nr:hypothetical protein E4U42_003156 [Claviceps africana]
MLTSICKPADEGRRRSPDQQHALIYLVCGNPGLIGFYVDFLEALRNLLDGSQGPIAYDLYGRNLAGFCDEEHAPFGPDNPPLDVDAQVDAVYRDVASRRTASGAPYDFVVLMGHSIGAYICVEIFHRHARAPPPQPRLRHGFLLFPTIASLGLSPAGVRFNRLRGLPTMETHLVRYARALLWFIPGVLLRWIAAHLMGFSGRAADLTAEWLKSRDGLLQLVHMAKSEMDTILEDKWDDELWDAVAAAGADPSASSASDPPRFFFFYGRDDHWVANHVRDEFVERRRRAGAKAAAGTSITVDEGSIPHAFCVGEDTSWMVARKVHAWVTQIDDAAAKA